MNGEEHPFLPPTFEFLVVSLKTQAEAALGLIRFSEDPDEQPTEPNFRVARHAIDTLGMLQEKAKGNMTWEEERLLHNSLTELRFRFVQIHEMKKPAEPVAAPVIEPEAPESKEATPAPSTAAAGSESQS